MREALTAIAAVIAAAVLVTWAAEKNCHTGWKDSGMRSEFSFLGGRRVELPNGLWIPAHNYRTKVRNG